MTVAALVAFATLLASWLVVPAERRRHAAAAPQLEPLPELAAEAA
jgi:hypothetical protein